MSDARPFSTVKQVVGGVAEVYVRTGPTEGLTVTMRPDLFGTPTGDEIIARALDAHRERTSIVRGESA